MAARDRVAIITNTPRIRRFKAANTESTHSHAFTPFFLTYSHGKFVFTVNFNKKTGEDFSFHKKRYHDLWLG